MIKWADIPRSQRQTMAGLIDSASSGCFNRNKFYASANKIGYLESLYIIEQDPNHHPMMLQILREHLEAIRDEQRK